jgi:ubiquitin carboxyl-terminal hydrolase 36/42
MFNADSDLENSMLDQRSQETTFLNQVFGGYLQSQIECFRCKNITKSFEAFLDLSVDIHNGKSLSRALDEFTNFHQMSDDNKYHCERYMLLHLYVLNRPL